MTRDDLLALLRQHEDAFVERKAKAHRSGVIETIVAFANSVPPGQEAVLFLGVRDDKTIVGVENADRVQKSVTEWAEYQCFPPITLQCEVVKELPGGTVVAVIVPASEQRPHFAGHAYVRVGPKTIKASQRVLDELIASRNTKAGAILRRKGQTITVVSAFPIQGMGPGDRLGASGVGYECRIEGCTAFSVQLYHLGSGRNVSLTLEWVTLTADPERHRDLKIILKPG